MTVVKPNLANKHISIAASENHFDYARLGYNIFHGVHFTLKEDSVGQGECKFLDQVWWEFEDGNTVSCQLG